MAGMSQVARAIERIQKVGSADGALPEFSRVSGVPYTTLIEWRAKDWRPKIVQTLERLEAGAEVILARGDRD